MTLTEFLTARLAEKQMRAEKILYAADHASPDWEARPGYNLPYSELWAAGNVIARFTATRGTPLADGEDDQHQADLMLAALMGGGARRIAEQMLREVDATRKIVARCEMVLAAFDDPENGAWPDVTRRERSHARRTLEDMAAIWSDHADYEEAWRP